MKVEDLTIGKDVTLGDIASMEPIALGDPNSEHMKMLNGTYDLEKITNLRNRTYTNGRRGSYGYSHWGFSSLLKSLEKVFGENWYEGKLFSVKIDPHRRAYFTRTPQRMMVIRDDMVRVQYMSGVEDKAATLAIREILSTRAAKVRKELKANPSLMEKVLTEKKIEVSVQSVDAMGILHEAKEALGSVISALERGSVTDATINSLYEKIEKLKSERNSIRLLLLKIKKLDK